MKSMPSPWFDLVFLGCLLICSFHHDPPTKSLKDGDTRIPFYVPDSIDGSYWILDNFACILSFDSQFVLGVFASIPYARGKPSQLHL